MREGIRIHDGSDVGESIAQNIAKSFKALDASNARFTTRNYKKFEAIINAKCRMARHSGVLPRSAPRRLPRFLAVFCASLRLKIDIFLETSPEFRRRRAHLTDVIQK